MFGQTAWSEPFDGVELVRTSVRGLKLPGHVLRQTAEQVDFDRLGMKHRLLLAKYLFDAMFRHHGVGLAAPMVGISLRIVVATDGAKPLLMFNPEIVEEGTEREIGVEGNLCLPGVLGEVERATAVTVKWQDIQGQSQQLSFEGWIARIIFHEIEILDGRIFTDLTKGEIATSTSDIRAAAATSYVFDKPEKNPEKVEPPGISSCLTLPPPLFDLQASVLRRPTEDVDLSKFKRSGFRKLVEAMFRQQAEERGVGLAAPQVGLSLRLAVISNYGGEPLALINAELLEASEEKTTSDEGCLSIPGWGAPVERAEKIRIRNHTVSNKPYEMTVEGYLARIVQHEMDHLDGVLYPDHAGAENLARNDHRALAEEALASAQSETLPSGSPPESASSSTPSSTATI